MTRWLAVAFAGAIALGLLDVRLEKSLYDSNYLDVVASGLRILSFAGLIALCLLIALPLRQTAPITLTALGQIFVFLRQTGNQAGFLLLKGVYRHGIPLGNVLL